MNAPQLTPAAQAAMTAAMPAPDSDFERLLRRDFNPIDLLNGDSMDKMLRLAEQMASSTISVPEHLRGKVGDCLAIVTQAMLWNMNPFAVAQKTHIVSGRLGYEAQLVIAVVMNSGAIRGGFRFEYRGENGGLECRVGAVLRGESEITWGEWLKSSDVTTKNSPLWKTNPRQQMGYLQAKNWSRLNVPGAILGVYSTDELEDSLPPLATPGSAPQPTGEVPPPPAQPTWPADVFAARLPKWQAAIDSGKGHDEILAFARSKGALTDEQEAQIRALQPRAASPAESGPTFGDDSMGAGGGK